jgi:hypothetical protein
MPARAPKLFLSGALLASALTPNTTRAASTNDYYRNHSVP